MLLISAVTQCHTGSSSNSVMWNMATHMRCMVAHHLLHGSLKDTKTHTYKHTHTHTPVVCPSMCSLLTCVEPPACGARAACHCLSSVMDVPFVAHTHTHTHTHEHSQTVAGLSSAVLSTQGWVPPLFREEDVISLVKNPTYVACHSWLNPGFSFVQSSPSPLLCLLSLALPVASYLPPLPIYIYLSFVLMMKANRQQCMSYLWWPFLAFLWYHSFLLLSHVLGCRFTRACEYFTWCHLSYTKYIHAGPALCVRSQLMPKKKCAHIRHHEQQMQTCTFKKKMEDKQTKNGYDIHLVENFAVKLKKKKKMSFNFWHNILCLFSGL